MFHIVENEEHQHSVWPDFRKQELPLGWRFTGFTGQRDECLRQIAALIEARSPHPPVGLTNEKNSLGAASRRRSVAVPYPRGGAVRLFVFPHAGSGASSYHFLAKTCREDALEINLIQYPGREMRIREQPCQEMREMVQMLEADLRALFAERPFAFLGHSMGSLVAFELTRRLAATGGPLPRHLFLSGRQAPQQPALNLPVDSMTDEAFLDAVGRRYNALPAELMSNPEILALVLPSLRADFRLMARYHHQISPPLTMGLTLLNGQEDPWVDRDSVGAWAIQSRQPVQQYWFPGGHFYLPDAVVKVRRVVLDALGLQG